MDLTALKTALSDEQYAELTKFVDDLTGQRDAARKESIEHRKSMKAKVTELEAVNTELKRSQDEMLERLGVDSIEQLKEIDPKGQADVVKQFEMKMKRIESQLNERTSAYEEMSNKYRQSLQAAAMRKALSGHEWIDQDLVESFVSSRLTLEEDQVLFKTDSGITIPLEEGLQTLAKEKPHLLKATGAGGSGYRGKPASGAKHMVNPWAKETRNLTQQIEMMRDDPNRAAQLKADAGIE